MKINGVKKEKTFIVAAILLILALASGVYFLVIMPKLETVTMQEKALKREQELLVELQKQTAGITTVTSESTVALQKQVPVQPLTEQLLLDLEQAEVVSNSFVTNMQFTAGEEVTEQTPLEADIEEQLDSESTDEAAKANTVAEALPTGIKKMTVSMTVESPTYQELEKFLQTLEQLQRIIVVDALVFSGNEEIISTEQSDKILTYQVTLSTFYMPTLDDLISSLPQLEIPKWDEREDPFSTFGTYSGGQVESNSNGLLDSPPSKQETDTKTNPTTEDTKKNESPSDKKVAKKDETYKVVSYKVQPGDTMFMLAVKYYNNTRDGVDLIRTWNNLPSTKLQAWTTIEIPLPVNGEI